MKARPRRPSQDRVSVSLSPGRLVRLKQSVQRGEAPSVSAYVEDALAEKEERRQLFELLHEMDQEFGPPTRAEFGWARQVLGL